MKKLIFSFTLVFLSIGLLAQEGSLGIFAGASYYNGELNPRSVFYMPSFAIGGLYRHNFNKRLTLRLEGTYTTLKGDDSRSDNTYQLARNYSFANKIWDLGGLVEFNFMDYETDDIFNDYFTPYLATGVLLTIVPDSRKPFEIAVPIGIGFKYAVSKKVTAGLEWNYRWTNSDEIDGLAEDNFLMGDKQESYNPDTDWYSYAGFIISIRVFKEDITCPAF